MFVTLAKDMLSALSGAPPFHIPDGLYIASEAGGACTAIGMKFADVGLLDVPVIKQLLEQEKAKGFWVNAKSVWVNSYESIDKGRGGVYVERSGTAKTVFDSKELRTGRRVLCARQAPGASETALLGSKPTVDTSSMDGSTDHETCS